MTDDGKSKSSSSIDGSNLMTVDVLSSSSFSHCLKKTLYIILDTIVKLQNCK